ncbi:MAG: class I SAM-dependent RNA methyltransferase, partial [Clostridiales bacterium]|nr:class I SAM-dependent RNA methyltransferase [Candidatus Apopatousia equi]
IETKVECCEGSEKPYEYRNKLQLPVGIIFEKIDDEILEKNTIGFYAINSNRIVPTNTCDLHGKWAEDLISIFHEFIEKTKQKCGYYANKKEGIKHIVARYIQNRLMLTVVIVQNELKNSEILINLLKQKFDDFSLYININKKDTNVIFGDKFIHLFGKKEQELETYISNDHEIIKNEANNEIKNQTKNEKSGEIKVKIKHKISPQSFMQVNSYIQNKIYNEVLSNISKDSIVIDAYSGAGLLSGIMSKKAKHVFGIEIIEDATKNANELTRENNIKNLTNLRGDCSEILPTLLHQIRSNETIKISNKNTETLNIENFENSTENVDIQVVLDPPRKGCDEKVLKAILSSKPNKIIYISCASNTLARDLKILLNNSSENNTENSKINNEKSTESTNENNCNSIDYANENSGNSIETINQNSENCAVCKNQNNAVNTAEYRIKYVKPFDMFPQTCHVETLAILEKIEKN